MAKVRSGYAVAGACVKENNSSRVVCRFLVCKFDPFGSQASTNIEELSKNDQGAFGSRACFRFASFVSRFQIRHTLDLQSPDQIRFGRAYFIRTLNWVGP